MESQFVLNVRRSAEDSFASGLGERCARYTGKAAEIAAHIISETK